MAEKIESLDFPLDGADVASIVLAGALENRLKWDRSGNSVLCADLEIQMMEILYNARDRVPLINEHYLFDGTSGIVPYRSEEVGRAVFELTRLGSLRLLVGEGKIVTPGIRVYGTEALEKGTISQEDYQKLKNLGKNIRVKRVVYS